MPRPAAGVAMRALIQRVAEASVRVDKRIVGAIGPGLLVLAGVAADDAAADREWLARKIVSPCASSPTTPA